MTERKAFAATLPYPPSVNSIWRRVGNKTLLSAEGREYHERVESAVALLIWVGCRVCIMWGTLIAQNDIWQWPIFCVCLATAKALARW